MVLDAVKLASVHGRMLDLLRVIRRGPAVKDRVDAAIDQAAVVYNLRDSIEAARAQAERATIEHQKAYIHKGSLRIIWKLLHSYLYSFRAAKPEKVLPTHPFPILSPVN